MVAAGLPGSSSILPARAHGAVQADACSNASLKGNYAFVLRGGPVLGVDGTPLSVPQPQAVLEMLLYDGAGNFTASDTANRNGEIGREAISGTYSVSPDCTFTEIEYTSDGTAYHSAGVLVDGGNEYHFIDTDPGAVFSATGYRYSSGACSNASLNGVYGSLATGFVILNPDGTRLATPLPVAVIASFSYDGAGAVTASSIASYGAGGTSYTGVGTYTVNPDCQGTATITTSDGETGNTAFVVVDGGRAVYFVGLDNDDVFTGSSVRQ
jgi:hypothetical protein